MLDHKSPSNLVPRQTQTNLGSHLTKQQFETSTSLRIPVAVRLSVELVHEPTNMANEVLGLEKTHTVALRVHMAPCLSAASVWFDSFQPHDDEHFLRCLACPLLHKDSLAQWLLNTACCRLPALVAGKWEEAWSESVMGNETDISTQCGTMSRYITRAGIGKTLRRSQ